MALAKYEIVKYVAGETGLDTCIVGALVDFTPHVRNFLLNQLNITINNVKYEIRKAIFDNVSASTAVARLRAAQVVIDGYLDKFDTVYNIVPWGSLAKDCRGIAQILDLMKSFANNVPGIGNAPLDIPGFEGVNSYTDLKVRQKEVSYKLQQLINKETYASIANATLQDAITKAQQWVNAIDLIEGLSGSGFVYNGDIYLQGSNGFKWGDATLSINSTEYIIDEGETPYLDVDTYYVYYDTVNDNKSLEVSTGEYFSQSSGNVKLASIVITGIEGENTITFLGVFN